MTATKTMTCSQMNWNLAKGFAWYEIGSDGQPNDDWRAPIWTKAGCWTWDATRQLYELWL